MNNPVYALFRYSKCYLFGADSEIVALCKVAKLGP